MIGELSSALPEEGGYYAWVRRGLGNFWGFQEAWLSLVASIFDMAIYPTLFVFYLKQLAPWFVLGYRCYLVSLSVVVTCAALNLAGIRAVGITSLWLFCLLSAPFAVIVVLALVPSRRPSPSRQATPSASGQHLLGAYWSPCGITWDGTTLPRSQRSRSPATNVSARHEVAVMLVTASYVIPIAAMWVTRLSPAAWETGSWADAAQMLGGPLLRVALVLGGMIMRLRHVQCAGDELLPSAAGDGAGRSSAAGIRPSCIRQTRRRGWRF